MRKLPILAIAAVLALAACSSSAPKKPAGPAPDDVPQEVTCCIGPAANGTTEREITPVEQCSEEKRNPVDQCNVGPGENEPVQ